MKTFYAGCAALVLSLGPAVPVAADGALSKAETAFLGRWDIAHAEENPDHCPLTLLKDETIGGRQLKMAKGCAKALAWTADITAWRVQPDGTLVLADAQRHAVIGFKRDESGDLAGNGPDRTMYVLYPVKPGPAKAARKE